MSNLTAGEDDLPDSSMVEAKVTVPKVKRSRVKTRVVKSVEDEIANFYKLKGRYDLKYNTSKLRIIHGDGSLSEKKQEFKDIKVKCINCKRNVGTRFTTNDRHLRAICGDVDNPCKLNIDIKLGTSELFSSLERQISHDLNIAKIRIIKIKLKLLFDLVTEEQMEEAFIEIKESYKSLVVGNNVVQKELMDHQLVSPKEVMPSSLSIAVSEDRPKVPRRTLAAANENALGGYISNFKSLIKEYEMDGSADAKLSKMREAIDIYLENIIPTLDIIRNTLFKINTVVKYKKQYHLIQIKLPLNEEVLNMENPKIITNKK